MSVNNRRERRVHDYIQDYIRIYLKIDTNNMLMRSNDSELIRDLILRRDILSDNTDYKQERDAFLRFLNEELFPFLENPARGMLFGT